MQTSFRRKNTLIIVNKQCLQYVSYSPLSLQRHGVYVNGHQNNSQTPRILPPSPFFPVLKFWIRHSWSSKEVRYNKSIIGLKCEKRNKPPCCYNGCNHTFPSYVVHHHKPYLPLKLPLRNFLIVRYERQLPLSVRPVILQETDEARL